LVLGDQAFDLMDHEAPGPGEPGRLGLVGCDPRQLAYGRVALLAACECRRGLRQPDQRTGDAHPLACRVRAIAQNALHVLVVSGTRVEGVELELLGADQIEGLGSVERAAMSRVLAQPPVNSLMLGLSLSWRQVPHRPCRH
jgi:hypothetical protein